MSIDFQLEYMKFQKTNKPLTPMAGIAILLEAFETSPLYSSFAKSLPSRVSARSVGSDRLALQIIASFLRGHDCLQDMGEFKKDPCMRALFQDKVAAPRTMSDYLGDFEDAHLQGLKDFLPVQALSYRHNLDRLAVKFSPAFDPKVPHLSIDSTDHIQHAKKMEGIGRNRHGDYGYDSLLIFDELGLCWSFDLRTGGTHSSSGAVDAIKRAFSSYKFYDEKYLSGDSAYCNQDVIKACVGQGVSFTLTANHATTGWEDHIPEIQNWTQWIYSEEELEFAASRKEELPQIEVGRFFWRPSWSEHLCFPVVVKRTKTLSGDQLLLGQEDWKYYGVVSNLDLTKLNYQQVIEHHNKRGNAENFIKEEKYGYDLKHFPCQRMKSNEAYGLMAMVAHNLLRWAAIAESPHKPHFAKSIRRRFLNIPAIIVRHARQMTMRVVDWAYQEVMRLRQALGLELHPPRRRCTNTS